MLNTLYQDYCQSNSIDQKVKQKLISQIDLNGNSNTSSQPTYITSQNMKQSMSLKESKKHISKLFKMFKIKNLKKKHEAEDNMFNSNLQQIKKSVDIQLQSKYKQNDRVQSIGDISLRNSNQYLNELVARHNEQLNSQEKSENGDQSSTYILSIQRLHNQNKQLMDSLEMKIMNKYGVRDMKKIQREHMSDRWCQYLKDKQRITEIHQQKTNRILRDKKRSERRIRTDSGDMNLNIFAPLKTTYQ